MVVTRSQQFSMQRELQIAYFEKGGVVHIVRNTISKNSELLILVMKNTGENWDGKITDARI